jgi:hypothetical protein
MSDPWLEADEAAAQLGRTERQLLRYATSGRVRTRQQGRRKQYHSADVEQLAGELDDTARTRPVNVSADVGRALVEVVSVQRELLDAQREIMKLRERVQLLEQQRQKYIDVIKALQLRAK